VVARILLVETDHLLADFYQKLLSSSNDQHLVRWARSAQEAINLIDRYKVDLIISEIVLDRHNGVELLHELRSYEDWAGIPIIFISSLDSSRIPIPIASWHEHGIKDFISKSRLADLRILIKAVKTALQ